MRVSLHGGAKGSAKHNRHEFEADHIDKNKTKDNLYALSGGTKNCEEAELYVYEKLYTKYLSKKNKEHINRRQYKRVHDMKSWMKSPRYRAREEILQIGDMEEHSDVDTLVKCIEDYNEWKYTTFSSNCEFISCAIHVDETTPHGHLRETWFYHDSEGNPVPGINKGLQEAGVPLPNPNLPESKTNSRMQTYTAMCRQKWQEICISHGFEIETEPKADKQPHMGVEAYKAYKQAMEALEGERDALEAEKAKIEANKKQIEYLQKVLSEAIDYVEALPDIEDVVSDTLSKSFIVKNGKKIRSQDYINGIRNQCLKNTTEIRQRYIPDVHFDSPDVDDNLEFY